MGLTLLLVILFNSLVQGSLVCLSPDEDRPVRNRMHHVSGCSMTLSSFVKRGLITERVVLQAIEAATSIVLNSVQCVRAPHGYANVVPIAQVNSQFAS